MKFLYWPYEETTVVAESAASFLVKTPWSEAAVAFDEPLEGGQAERIAAFRERQLHPADAVALSEVLGSCFRLRNSYVVPRQGLQLQAYGPGLPANKILEHGGAWDLPAIVAMSASPKGEGHDPVTILTIVRRLHLLGSRKQGDREAQRIAGSDKARAALLLRQNHFVTERCEACLRPALAIAGSSAPRLEAYIRSERGHDKLFERGFQAMGIDPKSLPVCPSMTKLMELFEGAASRNFLAFCLMLDLFEEPNDLGALFAVLEKHGMQGGLESLRKHQQLDGEGGHASEAAELLEKRGSVSAAQVEEAVKLTELASYLMIHWPEEI